MLSNCVRTIAHERMGTTHRDRFITIADKKLGEINLVIDLA